MEGEANGTFLPSCGGSEPPYAQELLESKCGRRRDTESPRSPEGAALRGPRGLPWRRLRGREEGRREGGRAARSRLGEGRGNASERGGFGLTVFSYPTKLPLRLRGLCVHKEVMHKCAFGLVREAKN